MINDLPYLYCVGLVCVWAGLRCYMQRVFVNRRFVVMWFYGCLYLHSMGVFLCIALLCRIIYCCDCFRQFFCSSVSVLISLYRQKTNASIWFNRICQSKGLTPNYTKIKIRCNKIATQKHKNKRLNI
jgi:hypothetical protein